MANQSKTVRKKKNISKHVLKSREATAMDSLPMSSEKVGALVEKTQGQQPPTPTSTTTASASKKEKKKNRRMKDPSEAATYLEEWKQCKQDDKNSNTWKFNKNTQSWLIRHMYEAEKVAKGTFTLLIEYLAGLEGKTTRVWIRSEATRRALRYKQYEKEQEQNGKEGEKKEKVSTTTNSKKETSESTERTAQEGKSTNDDEREEQARWEKLSDHEKRKEYKRARKVLESINE